MTSFQPEKSSEVFSAPTFAGRFSYLRAHWLLAAGLIAPLLWVVTSSTTAEAFIAKHSWGHLYTPGQLSRPVYDVALAVCASIAALFTGWVLLMQLGMQRVTQANYTVSVVVLIAAPAEALILYYASENWNPHARSWSLLVPLPLLAFLLCNALKNSGGLKPGRLLVFRAMGGFLPWPWRIGATELRKVEATWCSETTGKSGSEITRQGWVTLLRLVGGRSYAIGRIVSQQQAEQGAKLVGEALHVQPRATSNAS